MKLMTEVTDLPPKQVLINHKRPVVMLGSCFSDNIGKRLKDRLFDVDINPFGTLYNPVSINKALQIIIKKEHFRVNDPRIFRHNGIFHSWLHHSSFSSTKEFELIENINKRIDAAHDNLKNASVSVLTFGTSYHYKSLISNEVVANCHKMPSNMFHRSLFNAEEEQRNFVETLKNLNKFNPRLSVIFTISPIRHLAQGSHDNTLSKSYLHLFVHDIIRYAEKSESDTTPHLSYFPAYEIMLDELRDYRFYAPDMTHPSEQATDYIFERFEKTYCDEETINLSSQCLKLTTRLKHRPIVENDPSYLSFKEATLNKIADLTGRYPFLKKKINNYLK